MNFLLETLRLGLANLLLHKMRSLLTMLGIIFGVSAVITMVAIGEGNKRKVLAEIEQLGARNIIVRSVKPPDPTSSGQATTRMLVYGLKQVDLARITQTIQPIRRIVPLKQVGFRVTNGAQQVTASVFGTTRELLEVTSMRIDRGRYLSDEDQQSLANVAVVGDQVAQRLFPMTDPLGAEFRIDNQTFHIVGILRPVGLAGGAGTALVGRDLNFDIYIPLTTAQSRFGDMVFKRSAGAMEVTKNEVFEIYVEVPSSQDVRPVADKVARALALEHEKAQDVKVTVPQELLEQAERTQRMFNTLMIAIASISLLVGGIGIMNIMLATVTERTREIGIRRALGATRRHIIAQFLSETTVLSGLGGLVGVLLGLMGALLLTQLRSWWPSLLPDMGDPYSPWWSVVVSFIVSVSVGIVFGLYPAIQAARQDPIVALRHD